MFEIDLGKLKEALAAYVAEVEDSARGRVSWARLQ